MPSSIGVCGRAAGPIRNHRDGFHSGSGGAGLPPVPRPGQNTPSPGPRNAMGLAKIQGLSRRNRFPTRQEYVYTSTL